MSYEFVIDSYAWVEYLRGSPKGKVARKYIEGQSAATSAITIAELRSKYLREGWSFFDSDLGFISTRTVMAPVDTAVALLAGEINHQRRKNVANWGMADSIVLATARNSSCKVVTGDPHFRGIPDAILI
jgi:predicted nucleic acid-binding protein